MESWRIVWRGGFAPTFSTVGLEALRDALRTDDRRLTQGSTTTPPPLMCVQDWPCEAADAIGMVGWLGDELVSVGQVEEFFARACFDADQRLGEPAACRWFLNWFDDTPRDQMRADLLVEVELVLSDRSMKVVESARAACPMVRYAPLGVVADYLDDHDRSDLSVPLRAYIARNGE